MSRAFGKIHQMDDGTWGPCHASKKACPKGGNKHERVPFGADANIYLNRKNREAAAVTGGDFDTALALRAENDAASSAVVPAKPGKQDLDAFMAGSSVDERLAYLRDGNSKPDPASTLMNGGMTTLIDELIPGGGFITKGLDLVKNIREQKDNFLEKKVLLDVLQELRDKGVDVEDMKEFLNSPEFEVRLTQVIDKSRETISEEKRARMAKVLERTAPWHTDLNERQKNYFFKKTLEYDDEHIAVMDFVADPGAWIERETGKRQDGHLNLFEGLNKYVFKSSGAASWDTDREYLKDLAENEMLKIDIDEYDRKAYGSSVADEMADEQRLAKLKADGIDMDYLLQNEAALTSARKAEQMLKFLRNESIDTNIMAFVTDAMSRMVTKLPEGYFDNWPKKTVISE